MTPELAKFFEIVKLVLGALGIVTAYIAIKTYQANLQKQSEDRTRDSDKELVAQAQTSLQWAYNALTKDGSVVPPESDRLNWLTSARHLLRFQKLAARVKTQAYKLVLAEQEEYWRHRFYLALDHNALASTGYFSTRDTDTWPEKIEVSSALVVVTFASWQPNATDPIDTVDRDALLSHENAFKGRPGRGLKAYVQLLRQRKGK